jgi:Family of unknown function (DUF6677)
MKDAIKASLLSGLLLPGLGHLYLKRRRRGWLLIALSLAAFGVIVWISTQEALSVVDSITSGEVAVDAASVEDLLANSVSDSDESITNFCWIVLGGCWIFGIVDSFRLGVRKDRQQPDRD